MKLKSLIFAALLAGSYQAMAQEISLIPQPKEMQKTTGKEFVFKSKMKVAADAYPGDSIEWVFENFEKEIAPATGIQFKNSKPKKADIRLVLNKELGNEAYKLNITDRNITIEAARPAGFHYALTTLKQLMPGEVFSTTAVTDITEWSVPQVSIEDEPEFGWRGFMLDEGRHFFGKEAVKRVIDMMALYKMNRFHWHLTEDQGWRIEIKKYPKLTEVGAWRNSMGLGWGDHKPDGQHYGGFYTQDDIREIVKYAQDRFIEIVPEVDIPGHSQAAVASYPELLACDPENKHEVWLWQGVSTDVINVAKPEAVQFAKDIIDEISDLFPFGYIHLGGDECPTTKWEQNDACKKLLAEIGSKNFRDLQIHFYKQLQDHIAGKESSKQKRLIFWNEVLHGNTAPLGTDITIMAWVGANAAAKDAAQRGMETILSPQIPYYINRKQSNLPIEPMSQGNGSETVEAVYAYQPMNGVPENLQPKYKGVQANFWTEWVCEADTVEYLILPRLAAVAEAGWTPQAKRDYTSFENRLQSQQKVYNLKDWCYGKHVFKKK